jgi:hypothetical protein
MKSIGRFTGFFTAALCGFLIAPPAHAGNGNGAPTGAHYNLNIIGVSKEKKALMKDPNVTGGYGHAIFVPLEGTTKILLAEGPDFQVLDKNGTDADGAKFQLPAADTGVITDDPGVLDECALYNADGSVDEDRIPDEGDYYVCGTGQTVYSVFARALGTPGGEASVMLCGTYIDETTGLPVEICSLDNMLSLDSNTRPGKFTNVTANLLYLYNVTINGVFYKRIPLFSDALYDYFWTYDNNGLKLLQLRFYWCSTLVPVDWPGEINDDACFVK